ncbi:MAG: HAD-IB family hydrolase [Candidatus Nanopelagicales bacterium]
MINSQAADPHTIATAGAAPGMLGAYRTAGEAAAAATDVLAQTMRGKSDPTGAAFFDVDNTLMKGASIFHFAAGLARRRFFSSSELVGFAAKQLKFVLSGSEDPEDMASATEAALSFVQGRSVHELIDLGQEVFTDSIVDKLIPGTLALAQGHLDAGQRVWLVTATPVELATIISSHLGLTGALGTVSEVVDGIYTGHLVGSPLHGVAKAEAIRALAEREDLDLSRCSAYSDSANDIPMLSSVGHPFAINPDGTLRNHARANDWPIRDFRRRAHVRKAAPGFAAGAGIAAGISLGYAAGRLSRR